MNEVPGEKHMRLADTMIQTIVFVLYWPQPVYHIYRLAFPAIFIFFSNQHISVTAKVVSRVREAITLEFERSRSWLIELRATAPAVFFPGFVRVLSAREDRRLTTAGL